ncbi:hypothetical protein QQX98_009618 [Neonectria punicea]|uniref:ARCA protein n=1 Tax=Neonectria punicea TaxID=979145 RepID=A0ABR1GS34_9HYPO
MDAYVSDRYHQRCLNSLVPMLGDPDALLDQDLFAAIVILRTLEEIEVPLSGADSGTHLFGSHLFVTASGKSPMSGSGQPDASSNLAGLRRAAFLVAFRQEVFTAFVSQRPVTPAFFLYDVDRSIDVPADDYTWTNRILLHVADALAFCFPDSAVAKDESIRKYEELVEYGEQWYANKPQNFNPIFYNKAGCDDSDDVANGRRLSPDIWLLSDTVVTGLLNYHLSRILLLAFDPRAPRLGPSRHYFLKRQTKEIKQEVKTMIGMANGNAQCAPHFLLACTGIALAGDRFEKRWEQDELMQFLNKAEAACAWSTTAAQQHLMEAWAWMGTDV